MTQRKVLVIDSGHQTLDELDATDIPALAGELTADELAAIQGADSPSAANPFATRSDYPRWVDLGLLDVAAMLATGSPTTLLTLAADERIVQIRFGQTGFVDLAAFTAGYSPSFQTPETIAGIASLGQYTAGEWVDTNGLQITVATVGPSGAGSQNASVLSGGPLTFEWTGGLPAEGHWAASTSFVGTIVEAGHVWYSDLGGASGLVEPTWANGFGATIADGAIIWTDAGTIPASGSIRAYVEVARVVTL